MSVLKHSINCLFFLLLSVNYLYGQTKEEIRNRADKLFESEQYVPATKDYMHLLSLDPLDHTLNFKYGACLLYNSDKKDQALRYLNYAVQLAGVDSRAFYFRGKAFHLNYQFDEAKKNYTDYLKGAANKSDKRYPVQRELEMCDNGKRLLSSFTEIVVADKKEIDQEKFFRIYSDSKTVGGEILVTEQFQSKVDKKMGHVPLVHFPPNAKAIYYASYGENEGTGLDIYIRRRLPDGKWGDPQRLPGAVNSTFDENYPYMHPDGKHLYFSSKGHNSMGGYDVFRSVYDEENHQFGTPENIDFAISSPDDDLFYVVDSAYQHAYFASARQSQDGRLHVYKVRVNRVPIIEIIIIGDFLSEINPEKKDMHIVVNAHTNGQKVGEIRSNKEGKYSFVFPQGGKYEYLITLEGSPDQYRFIVDVPYLDEFRPLKQRVLHTNEGGEELVKLVNMFDDRIDASDAMLAEIIREKARLDVNIDRFDLKELDAQKNQQDIIASLGFGKQSPQEIEQTLTNLLSDQVKELDQLHRIEGNLEYELLTKAERVEELEEIRKELDQKIQATSDPIIKHKLLTEAARKEQEKQFLLEGMQAIQSIQEELLGDPHLNSDEIASLYEVIANYSTTLKAGNELEALQAVSKEKELIDQLKELPSKNLMQALIEKQKGLKQELTNTAKQRDETALEVDRVRSEIMVLQSKLQDAKKKEAESLAAAISRKEEELTMLRDQQLKTEQKITVLNRKLASIDDQLVSLQNAIDTEELMANDPKLVKEATELISQLAEVPVNDYQKEIELLESSYPELLSEVKSSPFADLKKENLKQLTAVKENNKLTPLEKAYEELRINQQSLAALNQRYDELANKTDDELAKKEMLEIDRFRSDIELDNKQLSKLIDELKKEVPDAALSIADLRREIDPLQEEKIRQSESRTDISASKKEEDRIELLEDYLSKVDRELAEVNVMLDENPEQSEASIRKSMLETIQQEVEGELRKSKEMLLSLREQEEAKKPKALAVSELDPEYEKRMVEIENSESLNPREKQETLLKEREVLAEKVAEQIKQVDKQLKKNPSDSLSLFRKESLNLLNNQLTEELAENRQNVSALKEIENTATPYTSSTLREELIPGFDREINELSARVDLSALDREKELASTYENLLKTIQDENRSIEKELKRNPSNQSLLSRKEALDVLTAETKTALNTHNEQVEKLSNEELAANPVSNEEELIKRINPDFEKQQTNLKQRSNDPQAELDLIDLQSGMLAALKEAEINETDPSRKQQFSSLIIKQEAELKRTEQQVAEFSKEEQLNRIEQLDPAYQQDLAKIQVSTNDQAAKLVQREQELQVALRSELEKLEENEDFKKKRSYSFAVGQLEQLIEESVMREMDASSQLAVVQHTDVINREDFLNEQRKQVSTEEIFNQRTSLQELKEQETLLATYEQMLEVSMSQVQKERKDQPDDVNLSNKEEWLKSEQDLVRTKRRQISISIGELEQVADSQNQPEKELEQLRSEEAFIQEKLANEDLTTKDRNKLEKSLTEVQNKQIEVANKQIQAEVIQNKEPLISSQEAIRQSGIQEESALIQYASVQREQMVLLEKDLSAAQSENEKNHVLTELKKLQDQTLQTEREIILEQKILNLTEKEEVTLNSREELEQQKRRFTIRIGELTTELMRTDAQLSEAKKKDQAALEQQRTRILAERASFQERLDQVDQQLSTITRNAPVVNAEALAIQLSYNEERELASSDLYKTYEKEAIKALKLENEIVILEQEIKEKQTTIKSLLETSDEAPLIPLLSELTKLEHRRDSLSLSLIQARWLANEVINNKDEAMKLQNLVLRGVKPIETLVLATALLQLPDNGFAITPEAKTAVYSEANPIPVDVKGPTGLVYRVQIGAFAKPIPQDLFKEFNPVSGEKMEGSNITRYMAGFFNNSNDVVNAREQIRTLGYNDAFVVAYCDGERIPFFEARRREAEGTCVPKGANELMLEVAQNTAEKLGIPLESELKPVSELDYHLAPNAAPADPIEQMKGLFYTVQIGVFNRPVEESYLFGMSEILTFRLPNGQIRYSSGIFSNLEEALPRRDLALQKGVKGAFVTAYYQGERIPLAKAAKLLEEMGPSILEKSKEALPVDPSKEVKNEVTVKEVISDSTYVPPVKSKEMTETEFRVQVVTKNTFDEFPRDILNRYNAEGTFYYDEHDKRVKSVIYKNADYLPRLYNFRNDIDTVYIPLGDLPDQRTSIEFSVLINQVPGDLMDWMLRFNYRRSYLLEEEKLLVRLFGIEQENIEIVMNQLARFGVSAVVREETEYELDFEK